MNITTLTEHLNLLCTQAFKAHSSYPYPLRYKLYTTNSSPHHSIPTEEATTYPSYKNYSMDLFSLPMITEKEYNQKGKPIVDTLMNTTYDRLVYNLETASILAKLEAGEQEKGVDNEMFFSEKHPNRYPHPKTKTYSNLEDGDSTPWYVLSDWAMYALLYSYAISNPYIVSSLHMSNTTFTFKQQILSISYFWCPQTIVKMKTPLTLENFGKADHLIRYHSFPFPELPMMKGTEIPQCSKHILVPAVLKNEAKKLFDDDFILVENRLKNSP